MWKMKKWKNIILEIRCPIYCYICSEFHFNLFLLSEHCCITSEWHQVKTAACVRRKTSFFLQHEHPYELTCLLLYVHYKKWNMNTIAFYKCVFWQTPGSQRMSRICTRFMLKYSWHVGPKCDSGFFIVKKRKRLIKLGLQLNMVVNIVGSLDHSDMVVMLARGSLDGWHWKDQ